MRIVGKKISQLNGIDSSSFDGSEVTIIESQSQTGKVTIADLQGYFGDNFLSRPTNENYFARAEINMDGKRVFTMGEATNAQDAVRLEQLDDATLKAMAAEATTYVTSGSVKVQGDQKYIITFPDNTNRLITSSVEQTVSVTEGVMKITFPLQKPTQFSLSGSMFTHWLRGYGFQDLEDLSFKGSSAQSFTFTNENDGYVKLSRQYGYASEMGGTIDLSGNSQMTLIQIRQNGATDINVDGCSSLTTLYIAGNLIGGTRDFSSLSNLTDLDAGSCGMENITLPVGIQSVNLYGNSLTNENFNANVNITHLNLHDNNISTLQMTGSSALVSVLLAENDQMENVRVSNNPNLEEIWLNLSAFINGGTQYFNDNNLSAEELNSMFNELLEGDATIDITGNPGAGDCDISIAESKGYTIIR